MLSYQHIYHAGNKADVQKHLWLITVLDYLLQKDKPITWIDTHAGRGLYDLQSAEAQKIAEYQTGFLPLMETIEQDTSGPLQIYNSIIQSLNKDGTLRYYPGSAMIAANMLRKNDQLHAFDLHPQESDHLKQCLKNFKCAHPEKADGYERLIALTPPASRRGGALIDPSYEIKTEYDTVAKTVKSALKRWPQGIYMIWYPVLKAGLHEKLKEQCAALEHSHIVDEWNWDADKGLCGSGMIVFNPPYTTESTMLSLKEKILTGTKNETLLGTRSENSI